MNSFTFLHMFFMVLGLSLFFVVHKFGWGITVVCVLGIVLNWILMIISMEEDHPVIFTGRNEVMDNELC